MTFQRKVFRLRACLAAAAIALGVLIAPPIAQGLGRSGPGASFSSSSDPDVPTSTAVPPLASFRTPGQNLIRLAAGAFDPLAGQLAPQALPSVEEASLRPAQPVYWLVQAKEGLVAPAVRAVRSLGAEVAGFVPERTYLVRATPRQRAALAASPAIRWTGLFQPSWKLPPRTVSTPGLLDLAGSHIYEVYLFQTEPDPAAVRSQVAAIPGAIVLPWSSTHVLAVGATPAQLPAIAVVTGVEWVGLRPTVVPLNANARWVTDTGIRDVFSATAPGRLTGAGQTAAVADTGINYVTDPNGKAQAYFRDCASGNFDCLLADFTQQNAGNSVADLENISANNTNHRKMSAYFDLGGAGAVPPDAGAHGTHVSGSVTGDIGGDGKWERFDGMAPGARLVFQSIADPEGTLAGLPADLYDLFRQAYRPRDPASVPDHYDPADYANYVANEDARTHNNSYGLGIPVLDLGDAVRTDQFVWDHEDMTIVFSAGNGGPGAGSTAEPAVAKNILSSAASANGRQPMVSIDSLAIFSSHGPTGDGRLGPTVATPGQIVISAKGGGADEEHTLQGTSMSGPVLTGLATLVRQYFWDGWGPADGNGFGVGSPDGSRQHDASAALVKAVLVNGAVRMRGFYTGGEGSDPNEDGQWPSFGQGFGLVDLANSLFFPGDDLSTWYQDVYRADDDAFPFPGPPGERTYDIEVEEGQPLDVTLAYTDAPDALPAGTPATVNDLNLLVTAPDGTPYAGNNFNTEVDPSAEEAETIPGPGPFDSNNTVERVRLPDPAPGTYTVHVIAASLNDGPQGFSLAASGALSGQGAPQLGKGLLPDKPGGPRISHVRVEPVTGDTAWVRWRTNEPTTGEVVVRVNKKTVAHYPDSYNVGPEGFRGLHASTVETSEAYANKPVLGKRHEALLTGLRGGHLYRPRIVATDKSGHKAKKRTRLRTPLGAFGADAPDIAQLSEDPSYQPWGKGTQLYIGEGVPEDGDGDLGAFMFRIPKSLDPKRIRGGVVVLSGYHDITDTYEDDARYVVDLLDGSVENDWGTQDFETIRKAKRMARLTPSQADREGGATTYSYAFACDQVGELRKTLASTSGGKRKAAFRALGLTSQEESLFSYDFGFNRRSRGPAYRPRLLLYLKRPGGGVIDPLPCDRHTPAPRISHVTVAPAQPAKAGSSGEAVPKDKTRYDVSWMTNVLSDSTVLFKRRGSGRWIQVGSPVRTTYHMVEVEGLKPTANYVFVVRSRACNGKTTTDTNGRAGYDFRQNLGDPGTRQEINPTYTFEQGDESWTTESNSDVAVGQWERQSPGHDSDMAFYVSPYGDNQDERLISPEIQTQGGKISVQFWAKLGQEEGFDPLNVDWSPNGTDWNTAAAFPGKGSSDFEQLEATFFAPAGSLYVRFRFVSDSNVSSPLYEGVAVDDVSVAEMAGFVAPRPLRLSEGAVPRSGGGHLGALPASRRRPIRADVVHGTARC